MVTNAISPKLDKTVLLDQKDDLLRDLNKAKLELHRLISEDSSRTTEIESLPSQEPVINFDTSRLYHHLHQHPELKAFQAERQTAEANLSKLKPYKNQIGVSSLPISTVLLNLEI